ncbi:MAG: hypothetical protein LAT83_10010 [Kiritimatiellae bacterium]|nr:hypothetical protein [Kiritimatiellia bacterium]
MNIIKISGDDSYSIIELVDRIPETIDANMLGILHEFWRGERYFLPDGREMSVFPVSGHEVKNRFLWLFLANTVYNPGRKIRVKPIDAGTYTVGALKSAIERWLDKDDDILTQFLEEESIKMLLSTVKTFDDLLLAVRCINGEYETNSVIEDHLVSHGIPRFQQKKGKPPTHENDSRPTTWALSPK